jgi:hypothetical protein
VSLSVTIAETQIDELTLGEDVLTDKQLAMSNFARSQPVAKLVSIGAAMFKYARSHALVGKCLKA